MPGTKGGGSWNPRTQHFFGFDTYPQTTVFVATEKGHMVGSVTVTIDSENGLPFDPDFPKELASVRVNNDRRQLVAAVWRLVVDKKHKRNIKTLLLLMQAVIRKFLQEKVVVGLFVVHPKRKNVYKRLFKMEVLGNSPGTTGLPHALPFF